MTDSYITTKHDLMAAIAHDWDALNKALRRLSSEQMTTISDPRGWTVKDHISHLTCWERSVLYLLRGQPRHEGLGVNKALYEADNEDEINDAIQREYAAIPLTEVLTLFHEVHQQVLDALAPLSDDDLIQPYQPPCSTKVEDGYPLLNVVYGNTAHHFAEHLLWIETLVESDDR